MDANTADNGLNLSNVLVNSGKFSLCYRAGTSLAGRVGPEAQTEARCGLLLPGEALLLPVGPRLRFGVLALNDFFLDFSTFDAYE